MNVSDYVRQSILERARMPIVDPQDLLAERDALRAENERLRGELDDLDKRWLDTAEPLRAENERLNAALDMVAEEREAWKATFHRSHESRGEWLKACPLCASH